MNGMDYKKLGQRIKEERTSRHATREQMAEDLNISGSYLGLIERGERCLTLDTLVNIANYFKLSIDYLLRDSLESSDDRTADAWNKLTYGKTNDEKQKLIEILSAINAYSSKN